MQVLRAGPHRQGGPQVGGAEQRGEGGDNAHHRRQVDLGGALLHQQPAPAKPLQHLHPQPLGDREKAPLDARHDLRRRPAAQTEKNGSAKLLPHQKVRAEHPQKGQLQDQPRKQTPQGRLELGLPDEFITNLMRLP